MFTITATITDRTLASTRTVMLHPAAPRTSGWHDEHVIEVPQVEAGAELAAIDLAISCDDTWVLGEAHELVLLRGQHTPPFPAGGFVVVRRGSLLSRVLVGWASGLKVLRTAEGCVIQTLVQDASACGLSHWKPLPFEAPGLPARLSISVDRLRSVDECVWLEPYPDGAHAAVCLTDHPDFDTPARLELLASLFTQSDIRITKGVFPSSDPRGDKAEPGLDTATYRSTIELLHAAGNEIAFHGFGPRFSAPPPDECKRRCAMMAPFHPSTWIDHGTGDYLVTREAQLRDGTPLRDFLRPYGVRNYWSYADLWDNPIRKLSCWSPRRRADVPHDLWRGVVIQRAQLLSGDIGPSVLYPLLHAVRNLVGLEVAAAFRARRLARTLVPSYRAHRREQRALSKAPFVIYGVNGVGFSSNLEADWFFDTLVLNHPAVQLRGAALADLIRRSGLLIGHVYLCAAQPHLRGGCFEPGTREPRLAAGFIEAMAELTAAQRTGGLVTLPFDVLRAHFAAHRASETRRTEVGWSVTPASGAVDLQVRGPRTRTTMRATPTIAIGG